MPRADYESLRKRLADRRNELTVELINLLPCAEIRSINEYRATISRLSALIDDLDKRQKDSQGHHSGDRP